MERVPVSTNRPEPASGSTAFAARSSSFPAAISDFQRGAHSDDTPLAQTRFSNPADLLPGRSSTAPGGKLRGRALYCALPAFLSEQAFSLIGSIVIVNLP
jgi:hypothetical protein